MPLGPVELLIVQFPGNEVKGDIVPALQALVIPLANPFKQRHRGEQKQNGESERAEAHRTMPYCEPG